MNSPEKQKAHPPPRLGTAGTVTTPAVTTLLPPSPTTPSFQSSKPAQFFKEQSGGGGLVEEGGEGKGGRRRGEEPGRRGVGGARVRRRRPLSTKNQPLRCEFFVACFFPAPLFFHLSPFHPLSPSSNIPNPLHPPPSKKCSSSLS